MKTLDSFLALVIDSWSSKQRESSNLWSRTLSVSIIHSNLVMSYNLELTSQLSSNWKLCWHIKTRLEPLTTTFRYEWLQWHYSWANFVLTENLYHIYFFLCLWLSHFHQTYHILYIYNVYPHIYISSTDCTGERDHLIFYDGSSTNDPVLAKFCGGDWLPKVVSR